MKLLKYLFPLLFLASGCDNNSTLNNTPLQSPQWLLDGEDQPYIFQAASHDLEYLPGGNVVYAFNSYDSERTRSLGIWSADSDGNSLNMTAYPDLNVVPPVGSALGITVHTHKRLLAFAGDELLLVGFNGNFYHLDQTGALINQFTVLDLGYQQVTLVAHDDQQACWVGRNDSGATLLCMTADGSILWQNPVEATFNNIDYPNMKADLLKDGTLVTAALSDSELTLTGYDGAGAIQWWQHQPLAETDENSLAAMIGAGTHLVVGVREFTDGEGHSFNVMQFTQSGVLENTLNLPVAEPDGNSREFRLLPYTDAGYLVLTQYHRDDVYFGKNVAELQLVSFAGVPQWHRSLSLDLFGVDSRHLRSLSISVNAGVISVLQNQQSVLLYTPVVIPVGVARMVDNLLLTELDGQGEVLRENVIGRLRYMVDYEGGIYQFNEHGFYPLLMATDGDRYAVAGARTKVTQDDGPGVYQSNHALGMFRLEP
mgnify:CR=1 FL=1